MQLLFGASVQPHGPGKRIRAYLQSTLALGRLDVPPHRLHHAANTQHNVKPSVVVPCMQSTASQLILAPVLAPRSSTNQQFRNSIMPTVPLLVRLVQSIDYQPHKRL